MTTKINTHIMEKKLFILTRKAVIEACAKGIRGNLIGDNLRINPGIRFSDGYKSPLVARIELNIQMVVKHGGKEILGQAKMMQEVNKQRPKLFPEVFRTYKIDNNQYGMLLENLTGYSTLYSVIYEGDHGSIVPGEMTMISKDLFNRLEAHYAENRKKGSSDFVEIYTKRIREKINDAFKKKRFADILNAKQIIINGEEYENPYSTLHYFESLKKEKRIHKITHLIHGDPHLGNIFIKRQVRGYSVKLIDPNSDWGYSDYLYDLGKLYHWAEEVGFINYEDHGERANIKRSVIKANSRIKSGSVRINLDLNNTTEITTIQNRRMEFLNQLEKWARHLSREMEDKEAEWRLHLSIASAHAGLFPILKNKAGFLLAYAKTLYHLKQAMEGIR